MSQKKVLSHREKSVDSSELVLNLKTLVDKLWQEMKQLLNKRKKANQLAHYSHDLYKRSKNSEGNEQQTGQHWRAFKSHCELFKSIQQQVQAKIKAWKKFSSLYQKQKEKQHEKFEEQR